MNQTIESNAVGPVLTALHSKCAAHSQSLNQQRQKYKNTVQIKQR